MSINPYDIDTKGLPDSRKITDEKELAKLKVAAAFVEATYKLETSEVLRLTGLDKSDLSRLKGFSLDRFTIDRIVGLLDCLGYSTQIKVKKKKAS